MNDERTYQRAPGAAHAEVDGERVVVSPSDMRYHALNVTAAAIWDVLATPRTQSSVVDALLDEFEVDPDTCHAEVASCLDRFVEVGIAEPSAG